MTLIPPENVNYAATVVKLPQGLILPGLDNLVGVPMFGYTVLTQKVGYELGALRVLFVAETELDSEYARANNLYREPTFNADASEKGYLEANGRIRAIKLKKHPSNALLMPLSSLAYTGYDLTSLKVGDTFDQLNGHRICFKHVPKGNKGQSGPAKGPKSRERFDPKLFPPHEDTVHLFRNLHYFDTDTYTVTTQKLHGTSARFSRVPIARDLTWFERVLRWFGYFVKDTEYELVPGSRRAIKGKSDNNDFYDSDIWDDYAQKHLVGVIPDGYVVYGELIGWVDENKPIQKNYTYDLPPGFREFYVYRVTTVNHHGVVADLSWAAVKEFCESRGLKYVPELWQGMNSRVHPDDEDRVIQITRDQYLEKRLYDEYPQAIPLSDPKTVDEGVCIRIEGVIPRILKAKSVKFLEHETKQIDNGEVDLESVA